MKWWPETCKSGDMIRVRVGSIWHYGVFVSDNEVIQFGPPPVNPTSAFYADHHVMTVSIDEFAVGGIVERAILDRDEQKKRISPKKTVEIARARLGEGGYNIIHNNCEHFAYSCVFGVEHSSQETAVREKWLNRPLLDVYVMQIPQDLEISPVYPSEREQQIKETANGSAQLERYAVWYLLEKAARWTYNLKMEDIYFSQDKGKWSCDKFKFSLSHSHGAVAVAVSNDICGVDIENWDHFYSRHDNDTFTRHFTNRMCTSRERDLIRNPKDLISLWTKKESIFKCYGAGGFFSRKIDTLTHRCEAELVDLGSRYMLSVCGNKLEKLRFFIVDGDTVRKTSFEAVRAEI